MKVFIGTNENCGMIHYLSKGFQNLNHDVTTLVTNEHRFSYNHSYSIKAIYKERQNKNRVIRKILTSVDKYRHTNILKKNFEDLKHNDLFIFMWESILPNLEDLEILRNKNKKIVFIFIGSDVRHHLAFKQEFPENRICWTPYLKEEDLNRKIKFIRTVELHVDQIYSVPDQAGLQIAPYNHFYLPLDLDGISCNYPDNDIPIIVHAPSNSGLKGTTIILETLRQLEREGVKFNLKLLENVNNEVVKKELNQADIAIDQIHLHGPGMFGLEAMASGCVLATRFLKRFKDIFSPPAHYIDDSNLLIHQLRELLLNKELRRRLANEGRLFVEKMNSPALIAQRIINNLENSQPSYDYEPRFFLDHFDLKRERLTEENKRLNKLIFQKINAHSIDWNSLKERNLI